MKKIIYLITVLLLSVGAFAQAPQQISYQAVVRNSSNVLVTNSTVGIAISIVKDSANGTAVYSELQTATTNANGLFSIIIGNGLFASGSISAINWGSGLYFIKSQIDPNGGINFTISGTSQLLSVPYALYAANGSTAGKNKGDLQYWDGSKWVVLPAGANGNVLTMANGVPTWATVGTTPPTITVPTVTLLNATAPVSGPGFFTPGYGASLLVSNGGAPVTGQGVCWSTSPNPTLANFYIGGTFVATKDTFNTVFSGMAPSSPTTYYLRAYATNSVGTSYSNQITITTAPTILAPTAKTISATAVSSSTATALGSVTSNGGTTVTASGFCWSSTNSNPTLSDNNKLGTYTLSTDTTFYTNLSGLASSTTYYIRAYATNSVGTSYGSPVSFTTPSAITTPTVSLLTAIAPVFSPGFFSPGYGASLLVSNGGAAVTAQGVCWSTSANPTLANFYIGGTFVATKDTFNTTFSGMNPSSATTYYLRAYATNSVGTSYSNQIVLQVPGYVNNTGTAPTVSTIASSGHNIASYSILSGGNVTNSGSSAVTDYGVCYSTSSNPTTANSVVAVGSGAGSYTATLSGLNTSTTYYIRAYATNSAGTSYGNQVVVTTTSQTIYGNLPVVQTISATAPTGGNNGIAIGVITSNSGSLIQSQGICWSTSPNPAVGYSNTTSADGSFINGSDTFSVNISSLLPGTTYYFRAYASNGWSSTGYGNQISITTPAITTNYTIGQSYGGGTIFYLDGTGHGLIAALSDQGSVPWDLNNTGGLFAVTGATDTTLGSGLKNTTAIKTSLLSSGSYAANIATQTANGYSDWYLPSLGELQLMYINLASAKLGNLSASNVYWSSSEYSADATHQAWVKDFGNNSMYGYWKSNKANVRAIRKF